MYINPLPNPYCWDVVDLFPGNQKSFAIELIMPNEQSTGEPIDLSAYTIANNMPIDTVMANSTLRCSYDPNDKLVSPAWNGEYALFSDTLVYTIRFQNTGNDTAFIVRLEDQLSPDLDWESFSPKSASHNHRVIYQEDNGLLEVIFDNILLPDSTTNFAGSQGYFSFQRYRNE